MHFTYNKEEVAEAIKEIFLYNQPKPEGIYATKEWQNMWVKAPPIKLWFLNFKSMEHYVKNRKNNENNINIVT